MAGAWPSFKAPRCEGQKAARFPRHLCDGRRLTVIYPYSGEVAVGEHGLLTSSLYQRPAEHKYPESRGHRDPVASL